MKNILIPLLLLTAIGCEEEEIGAGNLDDCVNGTIVSTGVCTGNGVIISVETDKREIHKELEKYGDQKEITVFNSAMSEVKVGDQISFRILDLVDPARVCSMLWEGSRGPEASIEISCE